MLETVFISEKMNFPKIGDKFVLNDEETIIEVIQVYIANSRLIAKIISSNLGIINYKYFNYMYGRTMTGKYSSNTITYFIRNEQFLLDDIRHDFNEHLHIKRPYLSVKDKLNLL